MFKSVCSIVVILVSSFSLALAQQEGAKVSPASDGPIVTAGSSAERVRFAAPSTVVQMHLQVYTDTAQLVFDATSKGNVLDWTVQDGTGERLRAGAYLCVVTVKSLSGKLSRRIGEVSVQEQETQLRGIDLTHLTMLQQREVGPVEEDASIVVVRENGAEATTFIAHNGEQGQITRGRGALSFRLGDFFKGKDVEQMRLTPEGNLGIGITHPQAKLDVDGLIRTSRGIVFPDGTIQTTAASGSDSVSPLGRQAQPDTSSGTISQLAGKAGKKDKRFSPELFVNEDLTVNGNMIFTPPSPQFTRDITMQNNNGGLRFFGAPTLTNSPAAAAIQFWGNNSPLPGQLYLDSGAHDNGAVIIRTTGTGGTIAERMRVNAAGNVGIGTTNPDTKLDIHGSVASDNGVALKLFNSNASNFNRWYLGTGGAVVAADAFSIGDTSSYKMTILGNGKVGIGTTSPSAILDVRDNGTDSLSAVQGVSTRSSGIGVYGFANTGIAPFAVYGASCCGPNNRAGYFSGNVEVTANLIKPAGSFKIDHPLDPANKYLYHSFVESPDMKNIYDGNVTTDASGEAEVTLPDWFEALNKDFRYQLTVIGQFAQAIVAEEIKENRFKIKTSLPSVKVSWQVTGIRQDAYAERHRIPVEELKDERERGSYLHPEDFGQPEERGVQWRLRPEMMKLMKEEREKAQREKPQKQHR